MSAARFWSDAGACARLVLAVEAYLAGEYLTPPQVATMRGYLARWIAADWIVAPWRGGGIATLRAGIERLTTPTAIDAWLTAALELELDPL